jgi:DNA-binding NtrC family response regulator
MSEVAFVSILIADDDSLAAGCYARCLGDHGYAATEVGSLDAAATAVRAGTAPGIWIVSDGAWGRRIGDLVRELRGLDRDAAILAVLPFGTLEDAVAAMREGADDVLSKPIVDRELVRAIERVSERRRLGSIRASAGATPNGPDLLIGSDPRILRVQDLVRSAAATRATVLVSGESGTGKSLVARTIHATSDRRDGPFVEVSCGSLSETLLESELFGHVQGAFTGAIADKKGRFLAANGGTIFLDEINSASPALQVKLLRVLQERRFEPVGSDETREVDVRFVVATNEPLEKLVAEGRFRQDLYYRVNVITIDMPPLRDRRRDILPLAEAFLGRYRAEHARPLAGFSEEAIASLEAHRYDGNVRELEHAVERAVVLAKGHLVTLADLPESMRSERPDDASPFACRSGAAISGVDVRHSEPGDLVEPQDLQAALREPERRLILDALARSGWNRTRAARELGIDRTTLYKKIRTLGIEVGRAAA